MKVKFKSFSTRLSLNILLIVSVLFIITIVIVAIFSHKMIIDESTKAANNSISSIVNDIEKNLLAVETTVKGVSWLVEENIDNEDYLYEITKRIVEKNPYIIGSSIAFAPEYYKGRHFFAPYSCVDIKTNKIESFQLGTSDYDYFYMDWYQIPSLLKEAVWSEPYYDDSGGNQMMTTYSYPLKDKSGNVYAIITADISMDWLSNELKDLRLYENSFSFIITRNGTYISDVDVKKHIGETIFSYARDNNNKELFKIGEDMLNGKNGVITTKLYDEWAFVVYKPIANKWSMAIVCKYSDVFKQAKKINVIIIVVSIFSLIIIFLSCYYTVQRISDPLSKFSQSALSIAEGDFNTALPIINTEDEIGQLHDSFEYMQTSLTQYIEELKTTTTEKQKIESELDIARRLQMAMVPNNFPRTKDVDMYAIMKTAKEVGGDMYDFLLTQKSVFFGIGDVSGKGVPASLYMAILVNSMRCFKGLHLTLAQLIKRINDSIAKKNEQGMFVTYFIGRYDFETGLFEFCNAGHNPIVIILPDGNVKFLKAKPNIALGLFEEFNYEMESMTLPKGTRLVLYTDGVTEAERVDKQQYGEERLLAWATENAQLDNAQEACDSLYKSVKNFTDGAEQNDDITIMTIRL